MEQQLKRRLLALIMIIILFIILPTQVTEGSGERFTDVPSNHWAFHSIHLAMQHGIVNGYPDGTFKPEEPVKEAEFLAMLLRAYPEVEIPEATGDWHAPYYAFSKEYNWPVWYEHSVDQYNRGRLAQVIAATQGKRLDIEPAVQFMLDEQLSNGMTSATVAGYGIEQPLKRAEAVEFIFRMKNFGLSLNKAVVVEKQYEQLHVQGIQIGDSEQKMKAMLGDPARIDSSEYGFKWHIYNQDYKQYTQIGIDKGQVVALYTNGSNWESKEGVTYGSSLDHIMTTYGEGLEYITKGNTRFRINKSQQAQAPVYYLEDAYVTFFIDEHVQQTVTAVQVIAEEVELSLQSFYGEPSAALQTSFELQMFDLANAVRTRFGEEVLAWDDVVARAARRHSEDMSVQGYFQHVSPQGKDPFDRMKDAGVDYGAASENIAAGSTSAIFAHESLMNSQTGHRENILSSKVTHLGVGVFFGDGAYSFYYTQKFYTPR